MFFLGCPVVIAYSLVTSCVRVLMKRKWIFSFYLDKHFPKKQIKLRHNCRKPWLTTGLKNAIKTKNKLYKKSLIEANRDNIRKTWMVIKQAINRKRASTGSDKFYHADSNSGITSDPAVIANAFNNFFVNIGPTLSSKIPEQGLEYRKYMPQGNE